MAGKKYNEGKVRLDLLPADALLVLGQILTDGAEKYGDHNWEEGIPFSELEAALERHLLRWKLNQTTDTESGLPHMAHVAINAIMILSLELRGKFECDDRPQVYAVSKQVTRHMGLKEPETRA